MMDKIAREEHFMTDGMVPYFQGTYVNISKDMAKRGLEALQDAQGKAALCHGNATKLLRL